MILVILLSYLPRKKMENGKYFVAMLSMGCPDNALLVFRWHFRLVPIIPWGGKVPFLSLEGAIGTTVIPYRNEPYFGLLTAERFLSVCRSYLYIVAPTDRRESANKNHSNDKKNTTMITNHG